MAAAAIDPGGTTWRSRWRAWLPLAIYLLSRAVVLVITLGWFNGDTETYFHHGSRWLKGDVPYRDYQVEYPPAATLLFTALAAVGSYPRFRLTFIATSLLVDALVFRSLARRGAGVTYALAGAALYPVLLVRFDLFPAAATLLGILQVAHIVRLSDNKAPTPSPLAAVAGVWLGLGVALKLYPLLFFPLIALALCFRRAGARAGWMTFAVLSLAALAVVVAAFLPFWLAGSGSAVFSFLRYQGERGLQIESSYAGLLLLLHTLFGLPVSHLFTHHAHDVTGPAAAALVPIARVLHPASILAATLWVYRRRLPLPAAASAILATALVTTPVFSPQFLLWLLPLSLLAAAPTPGQLARFWVTLALFTTLVFPILYDHLIALRPGPILLLVVRNALLAALAVWLLRGIPPGAAKPGR